MDAIRKMSLMPAERLEKSTVAARRKGRLQEGADADVIAFDPKTVADRATYQSPREPSVGMRYVLVNGTILVDGGKIVGGRFPGRAMQGTRAALAMRLWNATLWSFHDENTERCFSAARDRGGPRWPGAQPNPTQPRPPTHRRGEHLNEQDPH
jgi:hypothetical protein